MWLAPAEWQIVRFTLGVCALSTLLILPIGLALAWLLARPGVTAPIVSATNLEQLQDLVAATRLDLEPSSIAQLDQASA